MTNLPWMQKEAKRPEYGGSRPSHIWGDWPPKTDDETSDPSSGGPAQRSVVRAILVDDQASALHNLRYDLRLEPDLEVVGEAQSGDEAIALAQDCRPDIVVMDVEMPGMDGVQTAERLRDLAPDCLVMLLTVRDSVETHERARLAGARVVVEKRNPGIFRSAFHDLVQFVKARNSPAWPEPAAAYALEA
jgi:CheY-like chemotaxis protein